MLFDILAASDALIVGVLAIPKWILGIVNIPLPLKLRLSYFLAYFMYVAPNYEAWENADTWPVITNDAITVVSIVKSGVDAFCLHPAWAKVSPWVEFFINLAWLVPAGGGIATTQDHKAHDWTLFAANVTFDVSGMMMPFTNHPKVFTASEGLTGAYGVLGLVTAGLYIHSRP